MSPTVEQPRERWYHLKLKDGEIVIVRAERICKPDETDQTYRLKREGQLVGEFQADEVAAWWVAEEPARVVPGE